MLLKKNNIILIKKDIVECFEKEERLFFKTIFDCEPTMLITDFTQLFDLSSCMVPDDVKEEINKEINLSNKKLDENMKNEIRIELWDKWVIKKIKKEFNEDITVFILMHDLYRLIGNTKKLN